jgi:hypothetical protein
LFSLLAGRQSDPEEEDWRPVVASGVAGKNRGL